MSGSVTPGYGCVRDVTVVGVFQLLRLIERLAKGKENKH